MTSTRTRPCVLYGWVLLATMGLLTASPALGAPEDSTCALPRGLTRVLERDFSKMRVVRSSDLANEDRALFQKEHAGACPGFVRLDFYGDGHDTIAVSLVHKQGRAGALLIVAKLLGSSWKVDRADSAESTTPVVWKERPGEYKDVQSMELIKAMYPAIIWCAYESWSILYAWTGSTISKVWISD